jgi:polar amino acid transport system substrate-binding protein
MKRTIASLSLFLVIALSLVASPLSAQGEVKRVAIKPLIPFVIYNEDGTYSGFSIDIIQSIADRNGWQIEWHALDTVAEVLDEVRAGQSDIGIAGISITAAREEVLDFSQPIFNAGLQIMTAVGGENPGIGLLQALLQPQLLLIPLVMLIVIVVIGHVVWLVERKNPDFPDDYLPGVGEGIWWAASSLIGAGDKMPKSLVGRLGALVWVITGIVLISLLTANLTAVNTIAQLQSSISSVDDLPGKRIVTVAETTSAEWLRANNLAFRPVETIEGAYRLLNNHQVDAIVFDSPVLLYYAATEGRGRVTLAGGVFARQDYGIALPSNSTDREAIDRALLAMLEDGSYDTIYERWFGG